MLGIIVSYWGGHMRPPSVREIAAAMGINSPNGVTCTLASLHAKGWIVWKPKSRGKASARGIIVPELLAAAGQAAAEYRAGVLTEGE